MHTTVTTTITSRVNLDTFTPEHSVDISAEDELPREVVLAVAQGACRSTLTALGKGDAVEEVEL